MNNRTPWNQGFQAKAIASSVPEAEGEGPRWPQGGDGGSPREATERGLRMKESGGLV